MADIGADLDEVDNDEEPAPSRSTRTSTRTRRAATNRVSYAGLDEIDSVKLNAFVSFWLLPWLFYHRT